MNKEILRLAIPNIISNISVPLLSTVDTALMGRLSELHIGAVGVGAMIFNFIYWNFGFLRMGTTGITAQAFGRRDEQSLSNTLGRAVLVAVIIAGLLMALQWPLGRAGIFLMNISPEQAPLVSEYFYIRIWAAPATLALFAFMGWFFGMQNAIFPLILTIFINIVNITLSFYLVHTLDMGIAGVAWGTVVAQYAGLFGAIFLFLWKYKHIRSRFKRKTILVWAEIRQFLTLNFDIFIRTLCLTLAFGFFYSQSSTGGELVLAANVLLLQYLNWMSYGVDGFAYATESLVGKYAGQSEAELTRRAVRTSMVWGMGVAVLFSAGYGFFGESLLYVFTNQADVIATTRPFLFWMVLFPLLGTPCYIWDGVFIGLTASRSMRNSMLLAALVYFGCYLLIGQRWGNNGLWLSLLLFMVARGIIQQLMYFRKGIALK